MLVDSINWALANSLVSSPNNVGVGTEVIANKVVVGNDVVPVPKIGPLAWVSTGSPGNDDPSPKASLDGLVPPDVSKTDCING